MFMWRDPPKQFAPSHLFSQFLTNERYSNPLIISQTNFNYWIYKSQCNNWNFALNNLLSQLSFSQRNISFFCKISGITMQEMLDHPYFKDVRNAEVEKCAEKIVELDFEYIFRNNSNFDPFYSVSAWFFS